MFQTHRYRRGASAIEFALVAPVLVMLVFGTVDYGWYFAREAQITSALDGAVRSGSNVIPEFSESRGECQACVSTVSTYAVDALGALGVGVTGAEVTPTIENVNGTCALVLAPDLEHEPLIGLVEVPDRYNVQTIAWLMNVNGC